VNGEIQVFRNIPNVVAGFTTRQDGVSRPPFDSLNLAFSSGDVRDAVERNRALLLSSVGFAPGRLVIAGQVHGHAVARVSEPGLIEETDGLVTQTRGLLLGIVAADCAAVLVADESGRCVGAAHAGWRGTVAGIVDDLLDAMAELDAVPGRLLAYVSPCISQRRFEVGPEVAALFPSEFVTTGGEAGKPHVDLPGALREQLIAGGVPGDSIEIDGRCTYDDPDFYSYRADRGLTGRMMGFIGVR
jgi:YfiH family protein